MSSKSWLAIDVGTAPMLRAQELRFAWERFVAGLGRNGTDEEPEPDDLREPIVDSWRRSVEAGIDPTGHQLAPVVADEDETEQRWREHPLARASPLIHDCLAAIAEDTEHLVVVTDASGVLLSV
jgi:transcriptional regulator of acetoin/glycerol metabolism